MDLPVISVPTLMSFAWNSRSEGRLICPIFDARREQVYAGAYCWEGDGDMPFQAVEDGAYEIEAFLDRAAKACEGLGLSRILVFGEGIFAYEKRAEDWKSNMQRLDVYKRQDFRILLRPETFGGKPEGRGGRTGCVPESDAGSDGGNH